MEPAVAKMTAKTKYIIIGNCPCNEELIYWNVNEGWTSNFDDASFFPMIILHPLPPGASGIMEIAAEGEPVNQYPAFSMDSPVGGIKIF